MSVSVLDKNNVILGVESSVLNWMILWQIEDGCEFFTTPPIPSWSQSPYAGESVLPVTTLTVERGPFLSSAFKKTGHFCFLCLGAPALIDRSHPLRLTLL